MIAELEKVFCYSGNSCTPTPSHPQLEKRKECRENIVMKMCQGISSRYKEMNVKRSDAEDWTG